MMGMDGQSAEGRDAKVGMERPACEGGLSHYMTQHNGAQKPPATSNVERAETRPQPAYLEERATRRGERAWGKCA